jgi:PIN domain nuclease of toxin-antitoxin system
VKVLLDTHTLLWAVIHPEFLSGKASKVIEDTTNAILVSAASAWEIATKVRSGKLPGAEVFERDFLQTLDDLGYELLSIDAATALRAARLTGDHRDPFDRMIAAQALALDIPVIGKDVQLDRFGVRRIW